MKDKMEEATETVEHATEVEEATTELVDEPEVENEEDEEPEEPEDELTRLKSENEEMSRRVLRAHADLENFKKRNIRERQESIKFANKDIFLKILDVLDNFDRAMMSANDPKDNFVIGVGMIQKQLMEVLTSSGVEEVAAEGKPFDPYLHEAIAQEPTDEHPEHTIIEVYQRGYRFGGTLLRPVKVKVAAPLESSEAE